MKSSEAKLIYSSKAYHPGYGAGCGDTEQYEYACACGKGKIVENHDNIPGFRLHEVDIYCNECSEKYIMDTSNGIRNWILKEK